MKLESAVITGSYAGPRVEIPIAELGDAALVAVTGDNGTGKTTTMEAVAPGPIYLRSPSRGTLYDIMREKDGSIDVVWSLSEKRFRHRILVDAVSKRTEAFLYNGHDTNPKAPPIAGGKVEEYKAAIAKHYPPYITYLASAFGATKGKGRFLDLEPADRKVLFAKMIGAEKLDVLAETAGEKARKEKAKLEHARGKVEGLNGRAVQSVTSEEIDKQRENAARLGRVRAAQEQEVEASRKALEAWNLKAQELASTKTGKATAKTTANTALESAEKPVSEARYELEQIEARLSKRDELTATANGGTREAESLKVKVDALDKAETDHKAAAKLHASELEKWKERRANRELDIQNAEKAAKALGDVPCHGEGEYAACELIKGAQDAKACIAGLRQNLAQMSDEPKAPSAPDLSGREVLNARLATATGAEKEASDARTALAALAEAETRVDALKQKIVDGDANVDTCKATLRSAEIEVEETTERCEAHAKSKPLSPDNDALQNAKDAEGVETRKLTEMETTAKEAERVKADLATARAEEAKAAEETDDWAALQKALRKIKTLEIDAAGPEVSEICTTLLHECYGTRFTVKLITQEAKAQKGKGMKETFDLQVIDAQEGTDSVAGKKSTGEKVVINEAFSSAIMVYNNRKSGVPTEDIFRDEFDDGINDERIPGIVRMMRKTVALCGSHRMYFITHNQKLAELADARLEFKGGKVVAA